MIFLILGFWWFSAFRLVLDFNNRNRYKYGAIPRRIIGTMTLIIFGGGVVANVLLKASKGYQAGWLAIATGWGIAVMLGVFVAQATGAPNADINPAVTLARYLLGLDYHFWQMLSLMLAELIGGFLGAVIVWLAYLPHWSVTEDSEHKRMIFAPVRRFAIIPQIV